MVARVPTHRSPWPGPSRHADYDRTRRNADSTRFYRSRAWLKTRLIKLGEHPQCELCWARGELVMATMVHHKVEIDSDPGRALDLDNLQSLCHPCHGRLHAPATPAGG